MNVVGYVSAYNYSYYLWALYDLGILRLFTQLDDSRGMLVSRNDNFRNSMRCLEYSDPDS